MITIFFSPKSDHQNAHAKALAEGCHAIGINTYLGEPTGKRTKLAACWGWRAGNRLRRLGYEVLVMERGYLGDRFKYTSLCWNGLNGFAEFPKIEADDSRFISGGFEMKPWKTGGSYALILGQVPTDASLRGQDMMPLYTKWAREAKEAHGLPVLYRPHPDCVKRGYTQMVRGTIQSTGTLESALESAICAITYNSNSAVDAVMAGVPTITHDDGAMARPVTGHSVGKIIRPDRYNWASELAWKQWTIDEIASGLPLVKLFEGRL